MLDIVLITIAILVLAPVARWHAVIEDVGAKIRRDWRLSALACLCAILVVLSVFGVVAWVDVAMLVFPIALLVAFIDFMLVAGPTSFS